MHKKWTKLGIDNWFVEIHHFSSRQYTNNPLTLSAFVEHCDGVEFHEQNERTIHRALKVACCVTNGLEPIVAIKIAWKDYPLINKY